MVYICIYVGNIKGYIFGSAVTPGRCSTLVDAIDTAFSPSASKATMRLS